MTGTIEGIDMRGLRFTAGTRVSRRRFLTVSLSSLAIASAGGQGRAGRPGPDTALARRLAGFYRDQESAKVVGLEYLRSVPSEARADVLVNLLCSTDRERLLRADDETFRKLLQLRQREEFAADHVAAVRGWILSRTECRLCALAAVL